MPLLGVNTPTFSLTSNMSVCMKPWIGKKFINKFVLQVTTLVRTCGKKMFALPFLL